MKYLILISIIFLCFSCTTGVKKTAQKAGKAITAKVAKQTVKKSAKLSIKRFSKRVTKNMTTDVLKVFKQGGYREIEGTVKGVSKPILVSPKFDPNLQISRKYTGDFDPVAFHKGNSRYVKDGMETNLGRMKRGLAPLYRDPNNKKLADHGYSAFELHHGGQKADPDYFALMAEDHTTATKILHPIRVGSEIDRASFSATERAPLYKELAEFIDKIL